MSTFRALVVDAADAALVGSYWSAALGFPLSDEGFLELPLDGLPPRRMWFNDVPEPRVGPNRVRARLRGSTALDGPPDPEGNEFLLSSSAGPLRFAGLEVDARDPYAQAAWWSRILDGDVDGTTVRAPTMPWGLAFTPSDAPKRAKNRWHWDIDLPAGTDPSCLGATILRPAAGEQWWTILADPEGNEFCAFPPA
ncbi:VOC family protein [Fodinicola acaciae]|uniref:VOC family protein n=1 Tax=Fodinicola acaciae TaxID=2681555 RepID=UPI0013D2E93F|nr:VOC family protein [Fodinicola acaciae]